MYDNEIVDIIWYKDNRNTETYKLTDYYKGFRLILRQYKTGYKFYVATRRYKEDGISEGLTKPSPVAYFKDCSLHDAKLKGITHFMQMIQCRF